MFSVICICLGLVHKWRKADFNSHSSCQCFSLVTKPLFLSLYGIKCRHLSTDPFVNQNVFFSLASRKNFKAFSHIMSEHWKIIRTWVPNWNSNAYNKPRLISDRRTLKPYMATALKLCDSYFIKGVFLWIEMFNFFCQKSYLH